MKSVLVLGAHPDDETMITGGTLALLSSRSVAVHILSATRGEGGELGEPPVCERSEAGRVREAELRCAGQVLGAASVSFLGYIDPLVGPDEELYPFEADFDVLAGQTARAIEQTGADVLISHGTDGEYGHPAHRLMHRAAAAAIRRLSNPPLFYSFAADLPGVDDHMWNESDPAHLALDIRPWLDTKEAAAQCHVSQQGLFMRRHPGETLRQALRTVETFHRHHPPIEPGSMPHDDFAELLLAAGAWTPQSR